MTAIINEKPTSEKTLKECQTSDSIDIGDGAPLAINASGHTQETLRHFNVLSLLAAGAVLNNCWTALAGTLAVAIRNGGPPGVIYEFLVVCLFYCFISASIAELGSAMPSSGGVYNFASVCGGKRYGRICGWFAGWWNFFAWLFGIAGFSAIVGNVIVTMYGLFHPEFEPKSWHVVVCYNVVTWMACFATLFLNRLLPLIEKISLGVILMGLLVTVMVCAIMPKVNGVPYAANHFVWKDWHNETGYSSNGFVFVAGMLNGAFVSLETRTLLHVIINRFHAGYGRPRFCYSSCRGDSTTKQEYAFCNLLPGSHRFLNWLLPSSRNLLRHQ